MTLLTKEKALYVKTAVIQCGVPDYHDDILNAEDIKRIFTSFNNQDSFDIHHQRLPVREISLLENYISKSDEDIAGTLVPSGSWNIVLRVDNPEIKDKILSGEIQGVSLTNGVKTVCKKGLTKKTEVQYKDLPNAECWIPHFISLVSEPANLVGLHVMDYNVYVEKSKVNESSLFGGHKLSFISKLKKLIAEEEAATIEPTVEKSTEEETEVEAEVETNVEEPVVVDKSANSEDKKEEEKEEEVAANEEAEKEEEVVEKATESESEAESDDVTSDYDARITALENRIAELESKIEDKKTEETVEEEVVEEEPVITKSKKITVVDTKTEANNNFYELSNRDPLTGKKIRTEPKIIH